MKTKALFIVVLVTLVTTGGWITFCEIQAQETKGIFNKPDDAGTGKVLGIHHYSLKQGVDPQEFERFIVKEYSPVYNELWPGVRVMVMKGERRSKKGQYIIVYEMDSLYVRNYYWPSLEEDSEATIAIEEKCGERCTQALNRLNELAERTEIIDYVALVK